MFEKLRNTFAKTAKSFSEKELREKDMDDILSELEISLMESDVATEVIDSLKSELKQKLVGEKVEKKRIEETVKQSLVRYISDLFDSTPKIDLLSNVSTKKNSGEPYIILFVGINGTGKTTTLAKVAHMLQRNKFSVVVAAADTYRAGAIEQLRVHTDRLNLKLIAQNYGSDPAAVSRDAVLYAKSHKVDCILIDSAGRMQTSKNLMDQISKINKVVNPDLKIFVGDSLAGNDTVNQAREFYRYVKFDGAILTKSDADARGGSAISIVKVTSAPILYLGVGQKYEDLKPFDKESFLEAIFGQQPVELGKTWEEERTAEPLVKESVRPKETKQEMGASPEHVKPLQTDSDPFAGITTQDIQRYAELFDAPPPEDEENATKMAIKIKKWINDGSPKPEQELKETKTTEAKEPDHKKKRFQLWRRK